MRLSTKVFVGITDTVNTLDILKVVNNTLNIYSREVLDSFIKNSKGKYGNRFQVKAIAEDTGKEFTNGCRVATYDFDSYSFIFGCGDSSVRTLFCCTHCHEDYVEIYGGKKVIFSLGCSGSCEEIAQIICETLVPFGEVFYDLNDCDDIDFQKFEGQVEVIGVK